MHFIASINSAEWAAYVGSRRIPLKNSIFDYEPKFAEPWA
jgi:hypothetical protein